MTKSVRDNLRYQLSRAADKHIPEPWGTGHYYHVVDERIVAGFQYFTFFRIRYTIAVRLP
jgi:hypothetical protein